MFSIYKALIISPKDRQSLNIYNPGFLAVDNDGKIVDISSSDLRDKYNDNIFFDYSQFLICPGFVDIHSHLSQYPFVGINAPYPDQWLFNYALPQEESLRDELIARKTAEIFFRDLINNGTTTVLTNITIHKSATNIAFEVAEKKKIRAIIGKVMSNQYGAEYLREEAKTSIDDSIELIRKWHGKNAKLFYALSPRLAITCSFELLKKVGQVARKYDVYIQTHLSEDISDNKLTQKIHPGFRNYTEIYDKAGILSEKTILAHCNYLDFEEIKLIKNSRSNIAHCPTSNRFLSTGVMPYRKYQKKGLKIGLGTDVGGGYSLSMFNEMREAIETSRQLNLMSIGKNDEPMTIEEAFYLSTLGGASALSLQDKIGSLEKGKEADFIVIDYSLTDPIGSETKYKAIMEILSKIIYRGNDKIVKKVYVRGDNIKEV